MKVKVFYREPTKGTIYRATILVTETDTGEYILPDGFYSKGHIERLIEGIIWKDYPYIPKSLRKKLKEK